MPLKCCIPYCNSNYDKNDENNDIHVPVYRLPQDHDERQRWLSAIPRRNTPNSPYTVVCAKHWPPNYPKTELNGKERPLYPPSIFPNIPLSQIPTPIPQPRQTLRSLPSTRNVQDDELPAFTNQDNVSYEDIVSSVCNRVAPFRVISYQLNDCVVIQSSHFHSGICNYMLRIYPNFNYEAFHLGVQCNATSLARNRITKLNKWSSIQEAICFLENKESTHQQLVILDQLASMKTPSVGEKFFSVDAILRGFQYFSSSRSLYNRLRSDFRLPSIRVLTAITSKTSKIDDSSYLTSIFNKLSDDQKFCIVLVDEIYIKPCLRYQGGEIYGNAVNDHSQLARTVLAIMVKCMFGGPLFIVKILPVCNLNCKFQFEQVNSVIRMIQCALGKVIAIICDNNHVNQGFYKLFETVPGKPWRVTGETPIFLLYDYVHLWKNVRNNWLTEINQEIEFRNPANGCIQTAKWSHLCKLYELESNNLVILSRLNSTAVRPNPIERQNVLLCLRVFCDETLSALRTHPQMKELAVEGTVSFIEIFTKAWKILNVTSTYSDTRLRDSSRAVISEMSDARLNYLLAIADMIDGMKYCNGKNRCKTFTKDTSLAISCTLRGIVELVCYLLSTSHKYVMIGEFSTDPLEKAFSKLRQSAGGNYFISAQQVAQKIRIQKAKLLLQLAADVTDVTDVSSNHACQYCNRQLSYSEQEVFTNLLQLESNLDASTLMSLVYIAGYICRGTEIIDDTYIYYAKYGEFTNDLSRGGLKIPPDYICQWVILCFCLFINLERQIPICKSSVTDFFYYIAVYYSFEGISVPFCRTLANIIINNMTTLLTPFSTKEPRVKVQKLNC